MQRLPLHVVPSGTPVGEFGLARHDMWRKRLRRFRPTVLWIFRGNRLTMVSTNPKGGAQDVRHAFRIRSADRGMDAESEIIQAMNLRAVDLG